MTKGMSDEAVRGLHDHISRAKADTIVGRVCAGALAEVLERRAAEERVRAVLADMDIVGNLSPDDGRRRGMRAAISDLRAALDGDQ